jgi:hypothetical protein
LTSKILIVNQSTGYLTIDIANSFTKQYKEVVLFSGPFDNPERNLFYGIKIHKSFGYRRSNGFFRLFSGALFSLHLFVQIISKYRKHKILYFTNPPYAYLNSLFFNNSFSIVIFDVYPDIFSVVGLSEKSIIFKFWSVLNKIIFKKSVHLFALSPGSKNIIKQYVEANKIKVITLWSAFTLNVPLEKDQNPFLKKYNLGNKFTIIYSGNLGVSQGLNSIVDLAQTLMSKKNIQFLIIGEGSEKSKLVKRVKAQRISNIEFIPWQPEESLFYSLCAANLAIVSLSSKVNFQSVPSKFFNHISVGSPILGIGEPDTELDRLINLYQNGYYTSANCLADMKRFILNLMNSKEKQKLLSERSLAAAKFHHYSVAEQFVF